MEGARFGIIQNVKCEPSKVWSCGMLAVPVGTTKERTMTMKKLLIEWVGMRFVDYDTLLAP